jgi:hypothetical protein
MSCVASPLLHLRISEIWDEGWRASPMKTRHLVVGFLLMAVWIPMFAGTLAPVLQWFAGALTVALIMATVVLEYRLRRRP